MGIIGYKMYENSKDKTFKVNTQNNVFIHNTLFRFFYLFSYRIIADTNNCFILSPL
jgi:hypothetical protein